MASYIPPQYQGMTLDEFLHQVLMAYPDVQTAIERMIDGMSDEYKAFHLLSLNEHVSLLWIQQRGFIHQVNRVSNIRGSTGYERYIRTDWEDDPHGTDEPNVAYRLYIDKWEEWTTIPLA